MRNAIRNGHIQRGVRRPVTLSIWVYALRGDCSGILSMAVFDRRYSLENGLMPRITSRAHSLYKQGCNICSGSVRVSVKC